MKVSGFTFVRNAVKYDYPIVEAIKSITPVCDEVIVAVGNSDDNTIDLIKSIDSSKIKIIETIWDDNLREGGKVLAIETNKAFDAISNDSDWAFYIQADEVFSEKDMPAIKEAMEKWKDDKRVEGLLFKHINFFGSYDFIADSHKWIKDEIRIIRTDKNIRSWKDAMSFRKDGKLLRVKRVNATIYHYGWVKEPKIQLEKRKEFEKLWHDDNWVDKNVKIYDEFDYHIIDSLAKFEGEHPNVMMERIKNKNWTFTFDPIKKVKASPKIKLLNFIYKKTGIHIGGFKNFKLA
jgi:hypothetical protein